MNTSAIHSSPVIGASTPPPWVDARTPLGRLIAGVLAVEPVRQLLFLQARRMMIRTAEGRGIPWRQRREQLRQQAEPLLASSTEAAVVVPPYYRARFHAYAQGNLCWEAACEAEQATDSVALRVWKEEKQLSPEAAQQRMRDGIYAAIEPSFSGPVRNVLDIGCSVGVGTLALADWLEQHGHSDARVSGLDLSPQMLAVARVRDAGGRIKAWHHGAAEATGLPAASLDLITAQFLCHELPGDASRAVLREAARLLRPRGVLALVDQDPEAAVIRAMPPALATLLKATEPYLEDYFRLDLPAALAEAGFTAIRRVASDHRHRVLVVTRA
ncbi:MAG: class I SAM-dependent methyltransferase [Cyanobium sp. CZS 48M]|nr:class I SAM-dependent methyltransferase [Cyanobium sp. CZS48M]